MNEFDFLKTASITLTQQFTLEGLMRDFDQANEATRQAMFRSVLFDWQRKQNMLTGMIQDRLSHGMTGSILGGSDV